MLSYLTVYSVERRISSGFIADSFRNNEVTFKQGKSDGLVAIAQIF